MIIDLINTSKNNKIKEEIYEIEKFLNENDIDYSKKNVKDFNDSLVNGISYSNIFINGFMYNIFINGKGIVRVTRFANNEAFVENGKDTYFEANYDVNSDNFNIGITVERLTSEYDGSTIKDYVYLEKKDNKVIKIYNDVKMIEDISDGERIIEIKNNNLNFSGVLNNNSSFRRAECFIKSTRKNGKPKFCYDYCVSENFGVDAHYYNLLVRFMENYRDEPKDLELIDSDANFAKKFINASSGIANDFINDFVDTVVDKVKNFNGSFCEIIEYGANDFDTNKLHMIDDEICEFSKSIEDQFLLEGLTQRIDSVIDLNKSNNNSNKVKVLNPNNNQIKN